MRRIFTLLFILWGTVGLVIGIHDFLGMTGDVGVGTSAYVATAILLWIGGMVLFGVAGLLCAPGAEAQS